MEEQGIGVLLCTAGPRLCALRAEHVVETLRPLSLTPIECSPSLCLAGLSMIRGRACPVLDLAQLLGTPVTAGRWVVLRTRPDPDERRVALAVTSVERLERLPAAALQEMPALLSEAASGTVESITRLDADLVMLLRTASLLPETAWAALEAS